MSTSKLTPQDPSVTVRYADSVSGPVTVTVSGAGTSEPFTKKIQFKKSDGGGSGDGGSGGGNGGQDNGSGGNQNGNQDGGQSQGTVTIVQDEANPRMVSVEVEKWPSGQDTLTIEWGGPTEGDADTTLTKQSPNAEATYTGKAQGPVTVRVTGSGQFQPVTKKIRFPDDGNNSGEDGGTGGKIRVSATQDETDKRHVTLKAEKFPQGVDTLQVDWGGQVEGGQQPRTQLTRQRPKASVRYADSVAKTTITVDDQSPDTPEWSKSFKFGPPQDGENQGGNGDGGQQQRPFTVAASQQEADPRQVTLTAKQFPQGVDTLSVDWGGYTLNMPATELTKQQPEVSARYGERVAKATVTVDDQSPDTEAWTKTFKFGGSSGGESGQQDGSGQNGGGQKQPPQDGSQEGQQDGGSGGKQPPQDGSGQQGGSGQNSDQQQDGGSGQQNDGQQGGGDGSGKAPDQPPEQQPPQQDQQKKNQQQDGGSSSGSGTGQKTSGTNSQTGNSGGTQ